MTVVCINSGKIKSLTEGKSYQVTKISKDNWGFWILN
jgi:hypothetical protein